MFFLEIIGGNISDNNHTICISFESTNNDENNVIITSIQKS